MTLFKNASILHLNRFQSFLFRLLGARVEIYDGGFAIVAYRRKGSVYIHSMEERYGSSKEGRIRKSCSFPGRG